MSAPAVPFLLWRRAMIVAAVLRRRLGRGAECRTVLVIARRGAAVRVTRATDGAALGRRV